MIAVTWAVSPGLTEATSAGSNEASQPLGAVPASLTDSSGAVPELATIIGTRFSLFALPETLRRWSAVPSASWGVPWTTASSSIVPVAPFAPVTVTSIGYEPCCAVAGGVALTFTVVSAPASTVTVWAFSCAVGLAVTVHPCGAVGSNVKVCWTGVSLVTLRLYANGVPGSPLNDGKSAVRLMPLLTTSATTTVMSASDRPPDASWPVTVMGYSPGDASGGTAISRSAVAPGSGLEVMEWMTNPPS